MGIYQRAKDVLWERLGLGVLEYPVPKHTNTLAYSLGGLTLTAFVILVITGVLLAQFYDPMPENAYESLENIMGTVYLGWFLRGIHYWTAQIMMLTLVLHIVRVVITASYKKPREFTWYTGVILFGLTYLGLIFTGTVLKLDQEGVEALQHNVEITETLGSIGFWFSPQFAQSVPLQTRVFVAHISILPVFLVLVVIAHFFLVKIHKISPLPWKDSSAEGTAKFTDHLKLLGKYGITMLFVVSLLALLVSPPLGAHPTIGLESGIKPWWMFLWYYGLENAIGLVAILYGVAALFGALLLVPLLDRGEERHPMKRKPFMFAVMVVLLIVLILSIYGYTATIKVHV